MTERAHDVKKVFGRAPPFPKSKAFVDDIKWRIVGSERNLWNLYFSTLLPNTFLQASFVWTVTWLREELNIDDESRKIILAVDNLVGRMRKPGALFFHPENRSHYSRESLERADSRTLFNFCLDKEEHFQSHANEQLNKKLMNCLTFAQTLVVGRESFSSNDD